ncbi:MAG: universal stress protein [Candidatus Nitrosomaritimum aestuariumsis]
MIKKQVTKILVPLDGSKNSRRGLEMAISVARQFGATITGVYSINAPPHSEFRGVGSVQESLNDEIKKFMDEAKVLAAQNGIVFKEKMMRGDVGYNIVKLAQNKKEKFNLIVIGSRGRVSVKEMIFGSVSNYVIHAAKIPVLIVK